MSATKRQSEAVLAEHLDAENRHDVDAIMETFAADAVLVWGGKPYQGHAAIRQLHEGMGFGDSGAFSDLQIIEVRRHRTEEAAIIIEQELQGRHTGNWEGVAATGREVRVPVCTVYEFNEAGLVSSERPHLDRWVLWKQINGER